MFATEILRKEHDAILKMLDALDHTSQQMLAGTPSNLPPCKDCSNSSSYSPTAATTARKRTCFSRSWSGAGFHETVAPSA